MPTNTSMSVTTTAPSAESSLAPSASAPTTNGPRQWSPAGPFPRISIRFCTQCRWMLRAAYYAQELISTFSTSIGEVALQPATGGTFIITIQYLGPTPATAEGGDDPGEPLVQSRVLWDRKADEGFPETKELKRRVRDVIEPGRDLGHVDRKAVRKEAKPPPNNPDPATATGETVPEENDAPGPSAGNSGQGSVRDDAAARAGCSGCQ